MKDIIDNLQWKDNSRGMYEKIMKAVPIIFKKKIKSMLENWILKNHVQIVTEDIVFKAINDIAPMDMRNKIISELEKMRSNR